MLILGVDIAKLNHVASLVDSNSNEIIFSNFKFQNNFNGFSSLKLDLDKLSEDFNNLLRDKLNAETLAEAQIRLKILKKDTESEVDKLKEKIKT